ncbi:MAG TPA: BTAD domain-containing putative transcriptional regulator [Pseudonocardia sp.]
MSGTSTVTLRVLGTFAASASGEALRLGGPIQRAVLARIVVAGNVPVSAERIVEDVWGERAAPEAVHPQVSRLRALLGGDAIPKRRGGYVVDRTVVPVDADAFVAEVNQGRQALAKGADVDAVAALESALARWVGERAFAGVVDVEIVDTEAVRLAELEVVAAEALADAHVRLGRGGEDVGRLSELAQRYPLRESLAARLVTALYAAGRQADALAAYEHCRHNLAEQLGVDPAPPLRRVHELVLAQEALVSVASAGPTAGSNLPPRTHAFVERPELTAVVDAALDDPSRRPSAVVLYGMPGAGKTELACELAHRRRREGRVAWWVAAEDPSGTAAGLADLALALGIGMHAREEDTRAALWAELDRSPGWVLVFDNADEPARLEPYLPTAVHGDVIITSRDQAWRRLARPIAVPSLKRAESVAYVVERSGDTDTAAAGELAELLGDLPLALQQACAYVEQTGMAVPDYVRLFRSHQDELLRDAGTVATTWGLAFDRLRRRSAQAAGLLETMSFLAADAVAVDMLRPLAAGDELDVQEAIGELLRLSLVDRKGATLRVHRLVQDVVRARLSAASARERLDAAAALCLAVADVENEAAHLVQLAAHSAALAWVPPGIVDGLAGVARRFARRALYPAAEQVLVAALELVDVSGTPVERGALLCQLGEVLDAAGRLSEALDLHERAVELLDAEPAVDDLVVAHAYNRLGHVLNCADETGGAVAAHERALKILRSAGRDDLAAPVLVDLGYTLWADGLLDRAADALNTGRNRLRPGDRTWAHATAGLGMVAQDEGRIEEAVALQRRAIDEFTRISGADHPDTAQAMDKLGYALRLSGRPDEAIVEHERAARLLERVLGPDDPRVAMTLSNLGLALGAAGRADSAVDAQTRAHQLFLTALGAAHASTLMAGRRRAVALAVAGRGTQAVALIQDVLADLVDRGGAAELGAVAADVAFVFAAAGDEDTARQWRARATA